MKKYIIINLLVCWLLPDVYGQEKVIHQDSVAVTNTLNQFVDAFRNLEWDTFRSFFDDHASAFFPPSANFPYRADGKAEIERVFRRVFDFARSQKSGPPFLKIDPLQLHVEVMGDVAVATFLLEDPDLLGRRTIVLKRENPMWRIIHLHASGVRYKK